MNEWGTRSQPIPFRSAPPPARRSARFRRWWIEQCWYVVALVVLFVVFWLFTGDTFLRWFWGVR